MWAARGWHLGMHFWHGMRRAGEALLAALAYAEIARDAERVGVDLDQIVVHHAGGVLLCALRVDARSVRHGAGGNARDFEHLRSFYDRHG